MMKMKKNIGDDMDGVLLITDIIGAKKINGVNCERRCCTNETKRRTDEHRCQLPLFRREIQFVRRLTVKISFDARRLIETLDDNKITNDTERNGRPISQRRTNRFPQKTMKIRSDSAERTRGFRAVRGVNVFDVHEFPVMTEDEQGEDEENKNKDARLDPAS